MKKALFANYAGSFSVAVSQVVAIPFYLDYLGPEGWGMVSAILTWSATALIVEAGFALSISRNVALYAQEMDVFRYLRMIERRYLLASVTCFAIALFLSLNHAPEVLGGASSMVPYVILLTAALVSGAPYRAVLVGAGGQVQLNVVLGTFALVRQALGVSCAYVFGSFSAVVTGMVTVVAIETVVRRVVAMRIARFKGVVGATDAKPPVAAWPFQLVIATIVGGMQSTFDRVFMSATLGATEFGAYSVAALLSISALQFVYPISQALIPRLREFAEGRSPRLQGKLIASLVVAVVIGLLAAGMIGNSILRWWLRDDDFAQVVFPLFILHLAGTGLNIVSIPLHLGMLAHRGDRQILVTNVLALCAQVVVLIVLSAMLGAIAGAMSWVAANAVLLLGYLFGRRVAR